MQHITGVLLIHGFTGSPGEMAWLGEELSERGFRTSLPVLCGHNDRPEQLAECTYKDWIRDAERALVPLRQQCSHVFVIGLSMGGALALHLAAHHAFDGVVTLAAPLQLSKIQEWTARILHPIYRWRKKRSGPDIRDKQQVPEFRSYDRYPLVAAVQLFKLLKSVRSDIHRITMPILILHSREDHTVPIENARQIYAAVQSRQKKLRLLERSYHILPRDVEKQSVRDEIITFIEETLQNSQ